MVAERRASSLDIARRDGPSRKHPLLRTFLPILLCASAFGQTQTTVRHYKERVDDTPPEIAQAEDAIQKNDFAGAETLLKKALDKDPKNYQVWFDLGFVLNHQSRVEESIHAYRQSVAARVRHRRGVRTSGRCW